MSIDLSFLRNINKGCYFSNHSNESQKEADMTRIWAEHFEKAKNEIERARLAKEESVSSFGSEKKFKIPDSPPPEEVEIARRKLTSSSVKPIAYKPAKNKDWQPYDADRK